MEWTQLPIELRKDLQQANILGLQNIHDKLNERRRVNILSYLQLASLRLSNAQTLQTEFREKLDNTHDLNQYMHLLNNAAKVIDAT